MKIKTDTASRYVWQQWNSMPSIFVYEDDDGNAYNIYSLKAATERIRNCCTGLDVGIISVEKHLMAQCVYFWSSSLSQSPFARVTGQAVRLLLQSNGTPSPSFGWRMVNAADCMASCVCDSDAKPPRTTVHRFNHARIKCSQSGHIHTHSN